MKKLIGFIAGLFFFFSGSLMAQEITGLVSDGPSGRSLPGANVVLNGGDDGTTTNASGRFTFTGLESGEYTVEVSYLGYESMRQRVVVRDHKVSRMTFAMVPVVIPGEEVVVTGTRTERRLEDVPVRMELISPKTFSEVASHNISGYLKQATGVNVYNPGGFISHKSNVVMRGMSGNNQARVLVLKDGIPINKSDGGSVNWNLIQPDQLQKVEITKGPGSSLYGGNALGGVINMITATPANKLEGSAEVEYGSLNTFGGRMNIAGNLAEQGSGFFYALNGYYRSSDGYVNQALEDEETRTFLPEPDTTEGIEKNTMEEYGLTAKAGYRLNDSHTVELNATYYDDFRQTGYKYQVPEGSSTDHDTYSTSLIYNGKAGDIRLRGNLYFRNEQYRKVHDSDRDSKYYHVASDRKDLGMMFHAVIPLTRHQKLTAGFDLRQGSVDAVDEYQNVTDEVYNRGTMDNMAFFLQNEVSLMDDNLNIVAGVRFDHARYHDGAYYIENGTGATQILTDLVDADQEEYDWNAVSPRISAQYRFSEGFRLFATYAHGFRPSILDDLCRSGFVRGGFKKANAQLEPEHMDSWELGADLHTGAFTFSPSVYYSMGRDFMYYVSTGDSLNMFGRRRPVRQVENIGEVEIKGVELEARYHVLPGLEMFASYAWNESKITEFNPEISAQSEDITGNYLTYVPRNTANAGIISRNRWVNASLMMSFTGEHFADDGNEVEIDSFTSVDLRLWKKTGRLQTGLNVENIFDTVQLVDDGYLNYGRFVRLEVQYSF